MSIGEPPGPGGGGLHRRASSTPKCLPCLPHPLRPDASGGSPARWPGWPRCRYSACWCGASWCPSPSARRRRTQPWPPPRSLRPRSSVAPWWRPAATGLMTTDPAEAGPAAVVVDEEPEAPGADGGVLGRRRRVERPDRPDAGAVPANADGTGPGRRTGTPPAPLAHRRPPDPLRRPSSDAGPEPAAEVPDPVRRTSSRPVTARTRAMTTRCRRVMAARTPAMTMRCPRAHGGSENPGHGDERAAGNGGGNSGHGGGNSGHGGENSGHGHDHHEAGPRPRCRLSGGGPTADRTEGERWSAGQRPILSRPPGARQRGQSPSTRRKQSSPCTPISIPEAGACSSASSPAAWPASS